MGKLIILAGIVLIAIGLLIMFGSSLPFGPGRLPGDMTIRGKNTTFYFPLATCLAISVIVSVLSWLFSRR